MLQIDTPQIATSTARTALAKDKPNDSAEFSKIWEAQDTPPENEIDLELQEIAVPPTEVADSETGEATDALIAMPLADQEALRQTDDVTVLAMATAQTVALPEIASPNSGLKNALNTAVAEKPMADGKPLIGAHIIHPAGVEGISTQSAPPPMGDYETLPRDLPTGSGQTSDRSATRAPLLSTFAAAPSKAHLDIHKAGPDVIRKSILRPSDSAANAPIPSTSASNGTNVAPQYAVAMAQANLAQPATDVPLGEASPMEPEFFQQIGSNTAPSSRTAAVHPLQQHAPIAAQQIAKATVQSQGGKTEIALNPEELGRVRIALTTGEAGVSVSIFAERPETTELMRRNIENLAREFKDIGYEDVSFTFGEQSDESENEPDQRSHPDGIEQSPMDAAPAIPITTVALRSGLDLKL